MLELCKNHLVSQKTFPTKPFLEIESYTLPNANEFQTFTFQNGFSKPENHVPILTVKRFRHSSSS